MSSLIHLFDHPYPQVMTPMTMAMMAAQALLTAVALGLVATTQAVVVTEMGTPLETMSLAGGTVVMMAAHPALQLCLPLHLWHCLCPWWQLRQRHKCFDALQSPIPFSYFFTV
jgi:hypothetical protein